ESLPSLKPGLWKFETQVQIPGLKEKVTTSTDVCLKSGSFKEFSGKNLSTAQDTAKNFGCSFKNIKYPDKNRVTYEVECEQSKDTILEYDYIYSDTSLSGKMNIKGPDGYKSSSSINAKRVGDCK
ncbi:MAG: DUF3617 domain-containing protein, partial [Deltaproteobacteria bacterium]|nr:DUF3617 domain-containing protein [Deltaproteobacteria bacterium]